MGGGSRRSGSERCPSIHPSPGSLSGSRTRPWCLTSGFKLPHRTRGGVRPGSVDAYPAINRLGNRRYGARRPQPQCPMRPPGVVMGGVHGKRPAQMPLGEDQHEVGDLGSSSAIGPAVHGSPLSPRGRSAGR